MKQEITTGIILRRTNYGEADRILTVLTPDHGKLRLMARGVRKIKSKLAGGIELFSTSHITFMAGRSEIGTLISTRLITHFGNIVSNLERVQLGYDIIKQLDRATEDSPESEYYAMLEQAFSALNDDQISAELIQLWFTAQLLRQAGHAPNLRSDTAEVKLDAAAKYNFDFDAMAFTSQANGRFQANDIKVLRLLFSEHPPKALQNVDQFDSSFEVLGPMIRNLALTQHVH